jgi:hypothetical protein
MTVFTEKNIKVTRWYFQVAIQIILVAFYNFSKHSFEACKLTKSTLQFYIELNFKADKLIND